MRNLSGNQIREEFLRFFETKQHRRVHSSSLVPTNDPTLLFTNAGMNQFKDVFLGAEVRPYSRAATSQKCVRAGGKHNDLENVGFTRRHHTFFEMLGNFSFGDYFKRDAIAFAWELLTSPDWFAIDKDRLYVTIFEGTDSVPRDNEAEQFWIEIGVPKERIFEMSAKDNFWQMGDTGPCGPCSEIFYDLGFAASETGEDKPFPQDDQRYVEIWNLVFMQFDRSSDGTLTPLPKPSIDTGMGLERLSAVLQGKLSNYESDLFTPLIAAAARLTHSGAGNGTSPALKGTGFSPSVTAQPEGGALAPEGLSPADTPTNAVILGEASQLHRDAQSKNPDAHDRAATTQPLSATLTPADIAHLAVSDDKHAASLRIIADHARASTFLISDGVLPANEGRGYVLRKILRRGIRHGRLLGQEKPFMHEMVYAVRDEMAAAYPELKESAERVAKVVLAEEQQFARVIASALGKLDEQLEALIERKKLFDEFKRAEAAHEAGPHPKPGEDSSQEQVAKVSALNKAYYNIQEKYQPDFNGEYWGDEGGTNHILREPVVYAGKDAFNLYETFGLPLDFIQDAARDAGLDFDLEGFERAKEEEQARARASWKGGNQKSAAPVYRELPKTEFEGYSALRVDGAKVLALVKEGVGVATLQPGETGEVVLDATSFYADSGGQVGDVGWLYSGDHNTIVAEVTGCKKPVQGVFAHAVIAKQTIAVGDTVDTQVNGEVRSAVMRNHTGTHLLHAALRQVLGTHVKQAGSLNDPNRLRFDFSHFTGVAEEELREIEEIVNAQILKNSTVQTFVDVPIDEAIHEYGAMALFGEKYGDRVRVVKIGDFSTELCGGTHLSATGEIGLIKLVGEGAVASGVRRVEAVSGTGALDLFRRDAEVSKVASQFVGGSDLSAEALRSRVNAQEEEMKKLRRELEQLKMKSASAATADAAGSAVEVKGIKVLAQRVDGLDKSQMRNLVDELRGKLGSGVVILGAANEGKVSLIVGVSKDLTGKLQAGKIVGALAAKVGGKGGGRPDLAEAGGSDTSALDATLSAAKDIVSDLLG
ncbi:alanine--tRNA ligase [Granulicella paludicola]|uniref:alanine--tRNA ligase n=1 Tax=Granulicella paludicola TaxID=474951 RepID=UPI0021DFCAA7|nr:alanine--tRNA ligase [Granulicella paludicola]